MSTEPDNPDELIHGAAEVGRVLGLSRDRIRDLDPILKPELVRTPGGRWRRTYRRYVVDEYRADRERLRAARTNLQANR